MVFRVITVVWDLEAIRNKSLRLDWNLRLLELPLNYVRECCQLLWLSEGWRWACDGDGWVRCVTVDARRILVVGLVYWLINPLILLIVLLEGVA
jgi:hypothetical protein